MNGKVLFPFGSIAALGVTIMIDWIRTTLPWVGPTLLAVGLIGIIYGLFFDRIHPRVLRAFDSVSNKPRTTIPNDSLTALARRSVVGSIRDVAEASSKLLEQYQAENKQRERSPFSIDGLSPVGSLEEEYANAMSSLKRLRDTSEYDKPIEDYVKRVHDTVESKRELNHSHTEIWEMFDSMAIETIREIDNITKRLSDRRHHNGTP